MRFVTAAVVMMAALAPVAVSAQVSSAAAPKRGSIQRTAILNAVRPAVELQLGPGIEFLPRCMQVWKGWALVDAEPRRRGGGTIDPRVLPDWEERDGMNVTALLRFRYGRWNLVGHAIGATDVWYDGTAPRPLMRSRCY